MSPPQDVIRYDLNMTSLLLNPKLRAAALAVAVLWIVLLVVRHAPVAAFIVPVLCLGVFLVTALRGNQIIVDPKQVRVPLRKAVAWPDVEYVEASGRWGGAVTLHLKNGKSWSTGLPLSYIEVVARIGQVPVGAAEES